MKSRFRVYLERQQPLPVTMHLPAGRRKSRLFVTIPCFDEPDLTKTLESLARCTPPSSETTAIVVVNASDQTCPEILEQNLKTIQSVQGWVQHNPGLFFDLMLLHAKALPSKWAGVGWARKIAMDEAIRLLDLQGDEEGILFALDADSTVSPNYLTEVEQTFKKHPEFNFVNLYFAHPVDDPALDPALREGIILYELYLRYLRNAMQWTGYPHAIHTVGSSFAVRATAYVKQGGMNRRQAGEDFHFLHKIILLGSYGHVTKATVFPSPRISHRVPFGTGAALKKWREGNEDLTSTYSLNLFSTLIPVFSDPGRFYRTDPAEWEKIVAGFDVRVQEYLHQTGTLNRLRELKNNCSTIENFVQRFFHLVNAFWIIQYLNTFEKTENGQGNLTREAISLLKWQNYGDAGGKTDRELLEIFRTLDK